MSACRLHVLGASGSGTTTLGRAVASLWAVPHADADDYFWVPTDPPFVEKRPIQERLDLMRSLFLPRSSWVLSGSIVSWGDPIKAYLDAVVFVTLDADTRLSRLQAREVARSGNAIAAGGARAQAHADFMSYARGYDDPGFQGRSRAAHEQWLATLACPLLRVDSSQPVADLADCVAAWATSLTQ